MFRHHLLLIYRNSKRFKSTFLINLIGLSSGLACVLLIYLWVSDELYIDRFHQKDDRLFQIMINRHNSDGIITQEHGPGLLASALAEEIPEVEYATAYTHSFLKEKSTLSVGATHIKAVGDFVSKDFFNMFSYSLIHGNKDQVLLDKSSIVVSQELAIKLFSTTENIIGKTIMWDRGKLFNISGVFENVPHHASYKFDFVLLYDAFVDDNKWILSWNNNAPGTYVVLKEGTKIDQLNAKIENFVKGKDEKSNVTLFARSYSDAHLFNTYENGVLAGGRIEYVKLFSVIAVFILLIACVNFMNLSTAKASRRIKELGIKKAIGVSRESLVLQFLGESILMSFLSLFLAVVIVVLFLPQFNEVTDKELVLNFDTDLIISILTITLFTGLISGSYPSLYLSGFKPAIVLKGKLNRSLGELWTRKGLVIFQFVLSVTLITSVLVVYKQIEFIQTKNLGYNKDNVISFEKEGWAQTNLEDFLSKIKTLPGVINAASMMDEFVDGKTSTYDVEWENKSPNDVIDFQYRVVSFDLIETLMIEMAEGRTFGRQFDSGDSTVIFNETAIKIMGLTEPIGKVVKLWGRERQIVGVMKDFQFASLYEEVKPLYFVVDRGATDKVMVRIQAGTEAETLKQLYAFYREYNPGFSFDFKFVDEDYQALYQSEKRVGVLSRYFAILAVLISCLGLFGLAAFTAERRRKEIGVRRVLGASELGIAYLLSNDFSRMVVISIAIALPISYLLIKHWLDNFAYKIELQWWYFVSASLITLFIACFTVGWQTFKASKISPTQCLRDD